MLFSRLFKEPGVPGKSGRRICGAVLLSATALTVSVGTAVPQHAQAQQLAQSNQVQGLVNRLDRLQRDILTLQQHVYQGKEIPANVTTAGQVPEAGGASRSRLNQVEEDMRRLNGQVEEFNFRLQQVADKLDRLGADMELRFSQLEQQGGPVTAQNNPATLNTAAQAAAGNGAQPGTLGVISQGANGETAAVTQTAPQSLVASTGSTAGVTLPDTSPTQQYRFAFDLLQRAQYAQAESAFGQFVEAHPTDPLAGNAQYWLGETHYVRGDFQQAALTFAEGFQTYPDSSKAPDNLLKLGLSLSALGNTADACGTFDALLQRYPNANTVILQRASSQKQSLSCP
ncbi:tol-pal system protein YbgF [Kiloniella sp. b19]|uniref:tol-pal system protein YbgF n=1 Tax=Kiloniella sp. GXU_MW_B19 TaxID=3141326 RepID=UPI0031D8809E